MRTLPRILTLVTIFTLPLAISVPGQKQVVVAAAPDLRFAMDSLVAVYRSQFPAVDIRVSYGSSGNFFEQISNGAPYDLFFSADIDYARKLKEKNLAISEVRTYGTGQIVLWSKKIDPNVQKMNSLLSGDISKIAIANPDHAPYGKRAVESLQFFDLYDKVKSKLVFGENISQTAQFVTTGAADIGIVALSLALSPNMQREAGKYWLIPPDSHKPLEQGYILLKHAGDNEDAAAFSSFIQSKRAISVLQYFGFN